MILYKRNIITLNLFEINLQTSSPRNVRAVIRCTATDDTTSINALDACVVMSAVEVDVDDNGETVASMSRKVTFARCKTLLVNKDE